MSYLHLNKNGLSNGVPTDLGRLTLLRELWLWDNGTFQLSYYSENYYKFAENDATNTYSHTTCDQSSGLDGKITSELGLMRDMKIYENEVS